MLVVTTVAGFFILSPIEQLRFSKTALATTLYASNFTLIRQTSGYFAPGAETNPFLHTWSLAVEEQFYLVWPAIVWIGYRLSGSRKGLIRLLAVLAALSFALCVWMTRAHPVWAFYSSPSRAWEFAVGGIACLLPVRRKWLGWLGLAGLLTTAALLPPGRAFPGIRAVFPVVTTVAMLMAELPMPGILQWIGKISYSWYLWHWPFLIYFDVLFPGASHAIPVLASFLVASVTHKFFENPIRFHPYLLPRPALSLSLASCLTAISLAICGTSYYLSAAAINSPEQRRLQTVIEDSNPLLRMKCVSGFRESQPRTCEFGDQNATTSIVLFGDSHAAHWFPAAEKIAREHHWKLFIFVRAACPAADVPVYNRKLGRFEPECTEWRQKALAEITRIRPYFVLVGSAVFYMHIGYGAANADDWENGTRRTIARLHDAGIASVVLHDVPQPPTDVPTCLSRARAHSWYSEDRCLAPKQQALDPLALLIEKNAVRGLNSRVLDFSDAFCTNNTCSVVIDGKPMYHDGGHITVDFAKSLSPILWAKINADGGIH
jgi:hypothetical protein